MIAQATHTESQLPTFRGCVLGFIAMGPVVAGVLMSLIFSGSSEVERYGAVGLPLLWFSTVAMPSAWFVTLLPTILAAVAFWASFKFVAKRWPSLMRSRHRFVRTAALLGVVSSILGWEVSIVWWSAARGQVIFGTSLFASIIIAPTGFVLGALLGWWYFRMRPNTTQQADAPPAGGAPLS